MLDYAMLLVSYLPTALLVLGALSVFVATIAKLTSTDKDDKLARFLVVVHDLLAKFAPGQPSLVAKETAARVVKVGARVVLDHRTKR